MNAQMNEVLAKFNTILNRHQDIEDILDTLDNIRDADKLGKIREANAEIGKICSEVLPG